MKLNVMCNTEDRFQCVIALLQSKLCSSFNAQNHLFRASRITTAALLAVSVNYTVFKCNMNCTLL